MGTAVGTKVFIEHGWRAGAALSVAWSGWQFFILFLRGPHCDRKTWFGYQGGLMPYSKTQVLRRTQSDVENRTPVGEAADDEKIEAVDEKVEERANVNETSDEERTAAEAEGQRVHAPHLTPAG